MGRGIIDDNCVGRDQLFRTDPLVVANFEQVWAMCFLWICCDVLHIRQNPNYTVLYKYWRVVILLMNWDETIVLPPPQWQLVEKPHQHPSTISIDIYSAINSNYLGETPTSQSLGQHLAIMVGWAWSIIIHMIISIWLLIPLYAHDIFHSFPMLPIIVGEIPHSYGHLLVIIGYKWDYDYTIYKWGYKYL